MRLLDVGLHLFHCELENHDYLWFSSFEISKTSYTSEMLHNYALSYALSGFGRVLTTSLAPTYESDLAQMTHYSTPAVANRVSRTRFTGNAVNDRTLRTDDKPGNINSPDLGWRIVIDPWMNPANSFSCYVFTKTGTVPGVVRLGKKGCAVRIRSTELAEADAQLIEQSVAPTHPVNPLDVNGDLVEYRLVPMPPHLLLTDVQIKREWFVISGRHRVQVPRRVASQF